MRNTIPAQAVLPLFIFNRRLLFLIITTRTLNFSNIAPYEYFCLQYALQKSCILIFRCTKNAV
jgi:hypothetical protein